MGRATDLLLKIFIRPEIFVYLAFFVFSAAFFVLNLSAPSGEKDIIKHYLQLNGPRAAWAFILVCVGLFAQLVVVWMKAAIRQVDPLTLVTRQNLKRFLKSARALFKNFAILGIPFALAFFSMSMALGPLNAFNANRLRDELLFRWDVWLTGTFPPFSLASFQYPWWFVSAVDFSFFYLAPVLAIFGAYLLTTQPRLFREAAGAFSLGLIILFAGWLLFPVLSPHDRFVDNVYELPIVQEVEPYAQAYQPQKEIAVFLENMRESKKGLSVLPTSTFPSAHVAWSVLLLYYAWRLWPWLGVAILPFALLSAIGTFFFAQHYFVDSPAGIMVSVFSIWVARFIAGKNRLTKAEVDFCGKSRNN